MCNVLLHNETTMYYIAVIDQTTKYVQIIFIDMFISSPCSFCRFMAYSHKVCGFLVKTNLFSIKASSRRDTTAIQA